MQKRIILFAAAFALLGTTLNAQVKIGSTGVPNTHAVLELDGSAGKGFLMPRMTNTQMNAIGPIPPDGLMVYNTTDNGVYIRRGGFWRKIPDPGTSFSIPYDETYALANTNLFSLENSSGVAGYSVFRGTTTAGNAVSGSATTGIGVNGTAMTGYGGYFAASGANGVGGYFSSTAGPALVTNTGNVGIGVPAPQYILDVNGRMQLRALGVNHTAGIWLQKVDNSHASFVGQVNDTTYGIYDDDDNNWKFVFNHSNANIGIATQTPQYPLTFANAVGDKISLFNGSSTSTTNHYGLGIQGSLLQMFTPSSIDDIAFGTGRSDAFTERFRFTGDGKLGIGVNSPTANLEVIGNIRVADGTQGNGKVLTSDAFGMASWKTQGGYGFNATMGGSVTPTGPGYDVKFLAVDFNDGGGYNSSTGNFTAPEAGLYYFHTSLQINTNGLSTDDYLSVRLLRSGFAFAQDFVYYRTASGAGSYMLQCSGIIKLIAGSVVKVEVDVPAPVSILGTVTTSFFSGCKIY